MIYIRALGPFTVSDEAGNPIEVILAQPKRAALLVRIAAQPDRVYVRRESLIGMFWPEQDEGRARGALRQSLYVLKQALGDDVISQRGEEEVGVLASAVWCDVPAFEEAMVVRDAKAAAELYRGAFLDGFGLRDHPEFERWADDLRDRLSTQYRRVLERLVEQHAQRGEWDLAVEWCQRLAKHDPYSSRVALKYMEALASAGDRASALRYAERHAKRLEKELDAAPSPDVEAFANRLRNKPGRRDERQID